MNSCHKLNQLTVVDFAELLRMMNRLIALGLITEKEKAITARRIAEEYELPHLYI